MGFRLKRSVRNTLDLFLAWIVWAPTPIAFFYSLVFGARILPVFAYKSFRNSMRLGFCRTAVEILELSNITVSESELRQLFEQCLGRGYFARASLLSRRLTKVQRMRLVDHLLHFGERALARSVADIDGLEIPKSALARTVMFYPKPNRRSEVYARRFGTASLNQEAPLRPQDNPLSEKEAIRLLEEVSYSYPLVREGRRIANKLKENPKKQIYH